MLLQQILLAVHVHWTLIVMLLMHTLPTCFTKRSQSLWVSLLWEYLLNMRRNFCSTSFRDTLRIWHSLLVSFLHFACRLQKWFRRTRSDDTLTGHSGQLRYLGCRHVDGHGSLLRSPLVVFPFFLG